MKFKFRPSNTHRRLPSPGAARKHLRLSGKTTLRAVRHTALITNYPAERFGVFEEENNRQKNSRLRILLRRFSSKIKELCYKEPRISTASLLGALCALVSVCVISAVIVVVSLFFKYGGPYVDIKIPDLTSLSVEKAMQVSPDIFEYQVIYTKNPSHSGGKVISQTPAPNVVRRLYNGNGRLNVLLTVSQPKKYLTLPDTAGAPLRDIKLMLNKAGIHVKVLEEYSPSVPSGHILSASREKGTHLYEGDSIILWVSLGKEAVFISVPELSGMNERDAIFALESRGLTVGEIKYERSKSKIGTVIAQSTASGSTLPEGGKVSFTVSGGLYY